MRRHLKRVLALIGAMVLTFTMCASVFAADDITLDGDEGASSFIGKYSAKANSGYKYLGFVTTKEATSDYKYLQITYTGDISSLRIEFNREDDSNEGPYWFNPEGQTLIFKTADGSEIPLKADKETTITLDLSAIQISIGDFRGMHLHYLDPNATSGTFEIKDAKFLKSVPGAKPSSGDSSNDKNGSAGISDNSNDSNSAGSNNSSKSSASKSASGKNTGSADEGDAGTSGGSTSAPTTGSATYPIAIAVGGIAVAGVALVASKKMKIQK